jgi:hypothetical protein
MKGRKKSTKKVLSVHEVGSKPPQVVTNPVQHYKIRYKGTSGTGTYKFTRADMLSRLVMPSSGTAAYRIFAAVRLTKIEIWGDGKAASNNDQVCLQFRSTSGPTTVYEDLSTSSAYPSHIAVKPPRDSLASFWSTNGSDESTVLCDMILSANAIVDISFDAVLIDFALGETLQVTIAITAGTAGYIGSPALDHSGSAVITASGWANYS